MDRCDHCNREVLTCDTYGLCFECQNEQEHNYEEYLQVSTDHQVSSDNAVIELLVSHKGAVEENKKLKAQLKQKDELIRELINIKNDTMTVYEYEDKMRNFLNKPEIKRIISAC